MVAVFVLVTNHAAEISVLLCICALFVAHLVCTIVSSELFELQIQQTKYDSFEHEDEMYDWM